RVLFRSWVVHVQRRVFHGGDDLRGRERGLGRQQQRRHRAGVRRGRRGAKEIGKTVSIDAAVLDKESGVAAVGRGEFWFLAGDGPNRNPGAVKVNRRAAGAGIALDEGRIEAERWRLVK